MDYEYRTYEELIVAIDYAGRLMLDDMDALADAQPKAPEGMHGLERIGVTAGSNSDALGAMTGFIILEGPAFPDGPHEICVMASGNQDVDTAHDVIPTTWFEDMGIRVKPGGTYRIWGQICCEDAGELGLCVTLAFQDAEVRQPKTWIGFEVEVAAADADVQCLNILQVAATIDPGDSTEIDGVLLAAAGDKLALGSGAVCIKLSKGTVHDQQLNAGGVTSELITGSGSSEMASHIKQAGIKLKTIGSRSIYVAARMVIEDVNMCVGGSLGLAIA